MDHKGGSDKDLPWDSVKALAATIKSLKRPDIMDTWDRMFQPESRARISSCVYGTTFPLQVQQIPVRPWTVVDSIPAVIEMRKKLSAFDNQIVSAPPPSSRRLLLRWAANHRTVVGVAAATVALAGATGFAMLSRSKKRK
jgi:hypothetical protein